jgi:hypothetical protein
MQGVLEGRLAKVPFQEVDHGAAEITGVALKGNLLVL